MSIDYMSPEIVERAAFACFSTAMTDDYKRTLFVVVADVLEEVGQLSINKLFDQVRRKLPISYDELTAVVASLATPFNCVKTNQYYRSVERNSGERKMIVNVAYTSSPIWDCWIKYALETYPELQHWKGRSHGTAI